jgi:peptidoglycan/LPS O-acetylase OafA/YrhL
MRAVTAVDEPAPQELVHSKNFIPELEGWRGAAIILLLLGHFGPHKLFPFGRLGVEFFFVLSGRLMAQILFVDAMPLRSFYIRRISRVFPALWLFAVTCLLANLLLGKTGVKPMDLVHAVTFTINYTQTDSRLDHIWSLCVEEHAYVLLSLVAVFHRKFGINVTAVLASLAAACIVNGAMQTWWLGLDYSSVYWRTDTRAASILLSAALFLHLRPSRFNGWVLVATVALGVVLNFSAFVPDPIKYSVGTLCLAVGVAGATNMPTIVGNLLTNRAITLFGLWSYSVYIWQQPFALKEPRAISWLLAAVSLGVISYYCFERPSRNFLNSKFS